MTKRTIILAAVVFLAGIQPSHAFDLFGKKPKKKYDCTAQIRKAAEKMKKRQYADVKLLLDDVKIQCQGNSVIDTVHYYMGMAQLGEKLPVDARIEFEQLIQNFPNSAFNEEAHFRLGYCSFLESNPWDRDQAKTKDAVRELQDFLDRFPESSWADSANYYKAKSVDKLARKEYETAKFYLKQGKYESAIVYYKAVMAGFPQSTYNGESVLGMATALKKTARITEAQAALNELLSGQYPDELKKRAEAALSSLHDKD